MHGNPQKIKFNQSKMPENGKKLVKKKMRNKNSLIKQRMFKSYKLIRGKPH